MLLLNLNKEKIYYIYANENSNINKSLVLIQYFELRIQYTVHGTYRNTNYRYTVTCKEKPTI